MASEPSAQLRIGELARRVGVSVELLRTWERRYGALAPQRSPGGYRLYSERDQIRLQRIREHLATGLSTAQAAQRSLVEIPLLEPTPSRQAPAPAIGEGGLEGVVEQLLDLLERFDEGAVQTVLDRALTSVSLDTAIREVVLPCLFELGRRWEAGEMTIGHEHFATNVIQGRLMALARGWDQGLGPLALLACPSGEQHALGLVCFGLALSARGWRVTYLGPETPVATIERTADALLPAVIVIAATDPRGLIDRQQALRALARRHRVALGGAGAGAKIARRVGAEWLDGDPVSAAEALTQQGQ